MSKNADNRGAENQRILFSFVKKIYPNLEEIIKILKIIVTEKNSAINLLK